MIIEDKFKNSPLHFACKKNNEACVKILVNDYAPCFSFFHRNIEGLMPIDMTNYDRILKLFRINMNKGNHNSE